MLVCTTRRLAILPVLAVWTLGFGVATHAQGDARTATQIATVKPPRDVLMPEGLVCDVVCGEIFAHRRFRERIAHLPLADRRALHERMGIAFGDGDGATVAIHVRGRLTHAEVDELETKGLRVNRSLFVPSVPGRHPQGFHLAWLSYDALDAVRDDGRFVRVSSVEHLLEPEHDIALQFVNIAAIQDGLAGLSYFGSGVTVAVADSGVDLDHPDLPTPTLAFDVTTGDWEDEWSTDVANTVIWHGTHVTGTVVGSGVLSGGVYQGGAPAAELVVHKIGNNVNGNSTYADMIKSVMHAAEIGADIYTVSYGGYDVYLDGSSPIAQAFDAAHAAGTLCFSSAGNSAQRRRHYSVSLPSGGTDEFAMVVNNSSEDPWTDPISLRVIWRDSDPQDLNVDLECLSLEEDEEFKLEFVGTSPRDTEAKRYVLWPHIPPQTSRTYVLRLTNIADSGESPLVHVYQTTTTQAIFPVADPMYTVGSPAEADTVLAVGAWVHRKQWTDFNGVPRQSSQTLDALATFSSRGPRIDGVLKPEIVAPGSMTISLRDSVFALASSSTISNDGVNDGSGPADYYVAQGTSMASPLAAAGAVLIREAIPGLTVTELRNRILSTASNAAAPNPHVGYGMIDVLAAITAVPGDLNGDGVVDATDLGLLLAAWGPCPGCGADLNGDGVVDATDLGLLLGAWSTD